MVKVYSREKDLSHKNVFSCLLNTVSENTAVTLALAWSAWRPHTEWMVTNSTRSRLQQLSWLTINNKLMVTVLSR